MTYSFYLVAFSTAVVLSLISIFLIRLIQKESQAKRQMRSNLVKRIKALPLPHVAKAMGINCAKFLYRAPLQQVNETVETCESCVMKIKCTSNLAEERRAPLPAELCPAQQILVQQHQ